MNEMKKDTRNAFIGLFAVALVVAVVGRLGLALMDVSGIYTYDYIAASTGTLLNQVCTVLTGPMLFAFMFLAALALGVGTAGVLLYAHRYRASGDAGMMSFGPALLWSLLTTVCGAVCAGIFATGLFSAVQLSSMESKLSFDGGMALMGILAVAAIVTLLAAAMLMLCRCLDRGVRSGRTVLNLVLVSAVCGLVVMVLTVFTFATIDVVKIDGMASALWFGIDTVVNVIMMAVALRLAPKGAAAGGSAQPKGEARNA